MWIPPTELYASLQRMQDVMCKKTLSEETLRKFIGPPLKESFMKYYGVSLEETEEMTRVYRECYLKVGINLREFSRERSTFCSISARLAKERGRDAETA